MILDFFISFVSNAIQMFPSAIGYTIYTKTECMYCNKVKQLLEKEQVTIIACDDALEHDRNAFLVHMDSLTGRMHRTFPFVFHEGRFIGGCDDTEKYYATVQPLSFTEEF